MNGRKISSTVREQRLGLTSHVTKVTTHLGASTESEPISGMINLNTPETGAKIKSAELESTHG